MLLPVPFQVGLVTHDHSMLGLKSSKTINLVDVDFALKEDKEVKREPEGLVGFTVGNKHRPQLTLKLKHYKRLDKKKGMAGIGVTTCAELAEPISVFSSLWDRHPGAEGPPATTEGACAKPPAGSDREIAVEGLLKPTKPTGKWESMGVRMTFGKAEKSLSRSEDTKFCLDESPGAWGTFGSYRMAGEETAQAWGPIAMERVCKGADKSYIMGGIK